MRFGEELKPGKLYRSKFVRYWNLDWVDPETGEILWAKGVTASQNSHFSGLVRFPILFVSKEEHRNGYWLYNFLYLDKMVQTMVHEEQEFCDFFEEAV